MYAPFEEMEGDLQGDSGEVDQNWKIHEEDTGCHPLEYSGVVEGTEVSDGVRKRNIPESLEIYTDPAPVRKTSEEEPIKYSAHSGSLDEWSEPFNMTYGRYRGRRRDYGWCGGVGGTLVPHGMDE